MIPRSVRGELLETFLREDVEKVQVRTFSDVVEVSDCLVFESFPSELVGDCLVDEVIIFVVLVDFFHIIFGDINHEGDGELSDMGIFCVGRSTRNGTSIELENSFSPIDGWIVFLEPVHSDNHLL